MKSIKPGRGPSMLGAIVCIALIVFGILWVLMAVGGGIITMLIKMFFGG